MTKATIYPALTSHPMRTHFRQLNYIGGFFYHTHQRPTNRIRKSRTAKTTAKPYTTAFIPPNSTIAAMGKLTFNIFSPFVL
jgi:hypothetical protein